MDNRSEQEKALANARKDVGLALEWLGLSQFVSLEEIEQELCRAETAFQSILLLGILRRIMASEDDKTAKLFIPAVTEWKNYLPREDLDGLTPFEYREKYSPGEHEMRFMAELMEEYQARLQSFDEKSREAFDVQEDFSSFQKNYLERIPAEQSFFNEFGKFMNLKEIIVGERRRNGHPEKNIDKIGAQIFAENTAEGLGQQAAEIDDNYYKMVNELAALQTKRSRRKKKRINEIYVFFKKVEPYFRCGHEPHRFYLNYASVLLLEDKLKQSLLMLDRALAYKPDYEQARKMKDRVVDYISQ